MPSQTYLSSNVWWSHRLFYSWLLLRRGVFRSKGDPLLRRGVFRSKGDPLSGLFWTRLTDLSNSFPIRLVRYLPIHPHSGSDSNSMLLQNKLMSTLDSWYALQEALKVYKVTDLFSGLISIYDNCLYLCHWVVFHCLCVRL